MIYIEHLPIDIDIFFKRSEKVLGPVNFSKYYSLFLSVD